MSIIVLAVAVLGFLESAVLYLCSSLNSFVLLWLVLPCFVAYFGGASSYDWLTVFSSPPPKVIDD